MKETLRSGERPPKVITFGTVEDFLDELKERGPELGLVRIDRRVVERPAKDGFGMRTGGVLLSARRDDEVLVANFVTGRMLTFNGKPWGTEEEIRVLQENTDKALAVLAEEVKEVGFTLGKGVYALPEELMLYQSRSQKLEFSGGRLVVVEHGEEPAGRKATSMPPGSREPGE